MPRVAPVALDRPSAIAGPLSLLGGSRRLARIALAVAMVGAAVPAPRRALRGRTRRDDRLGASPEATTPAALASPTAALATSPASPSLPATSTPSPAPSAAPAKTPKPTAKPAATRRYKVKSGDTLSGIAARFGTTVAVLKRLNDISDASHLRPGQVLRVPVTGSPVGPPERRGQRWQPRQKLVTNPPGAISLMVVAAAGTG